MIAAVPTASLPVLVGTIPCHPSVGVVYRFVTLARVRLADEDADTGVSVIHEDPCVALLWAQRAAELIERHGLVDVPEVLA